MIGENITQHDKIWINEAGQEVYAPSANDKEAFKRVKPVNEWKIRNDNMPPKSWAEIEREQKAEMENNLNEAMDDEAKAAYEVLKRKGIV